MEACAAALGAESSGSEVSLRPYLSPASQSAGGGNVLGGGGRSPTGGGWAHPGCEGW